MNMHIYDHIYAIHTYIEREKECMCIMGTNRAILFINPALVHMKTRTYQIQS